jgi:phosphopentomutase
MTSALRRTVILFTTLAFIVTSVGWGVAGTLLGLGLNHTGAVASASVDTGDHHADPATQHGPQCSGSDACDDTTGHQELADSCCGSTCHVVTQAGACAQILIPIARALQRISPEDDTTEAAPARLERPPRSLIG